MAAPFLSKTDRRITRMLSYPGIDKDTLAQKKINWIASVSVTTMILVLTLTYHFIFPQLRILIFYGLFLTIVFTQGIVYPILFRRVSRWLLFVDQTLVALATFIAILMLGGIPWSGGLVIVGFALIFFSLNMKRKGHSIAIYVIYVITVILAGILDPYLSVPPEMTPAVNISLFVANILWISGFAMVFVLSFISQRVRLEQMETVRVRELDNAKAQLYTNITHEFRTPLTVITGMNDLMRNDPARWLAEGSEVINRNAGMLLNLVNQMLDLAKLDAGALPVRLIRSDLNLYISYIVELFRSVATSAGISLNFYPSRRPAVIDNDPEKMMQIISNLVSNALKFTASPGRIDVHTSLTGEEEFEIRVTDNGTGIPEDFLPSVFDRFTRAKTEAGQMAGGSGLGLALTRELVTLLGGTITVESQFGSGTEFIVRLPVTQNAPLEEGPDLHELKNRVSRFIWKSPGKEVRAELTRQGGKERSMLMIVEDNDDVVRYLMNIFKDDYDVIVAGNGKEGIDKAMEYVPDVILSDIMMPLTDGIRMLEVVKNDLRTSHIPVVLLTARADVASRIEGLERGADAYIAKPFNSDELKAQVRSLVSQRRKLQERYAAIEHLELTDDTDFRYEDQFMKHVREIMLSNLSNEALDVRFICNALNMSRTQLYRKFRSLTNMTATRYLRSLRLHRARVLLSGRQVTVAEAAYRTGFRNVSHFSRTFTREFGLNPSELIR
ncbi:MAG: ATP-binding protein [Bacteroidales bacterium]|nr:ATP-binding protein [Bacteroidales bacterium]MDT8373233.1 ATP-binding protein [Bacteroidales bacterium]